MSVVRDHDRNFWSVEAKPTGLFRILCLGDSLTYGSGVLPDETLPAHLETVLNRAVWDRCFEVINCGVSGFSLYDDWYSFLHRGHRYQPDLVIIIICDNDAELFSINTLLDQGVKIDYQEHVAQCWDEKGLHFPHFQAAARNISVQMNEHNIPVVVAYYDIHNAPHRTRTVSALEELCLKSNIGFVDLSTDFCERESAEYHPDYKASEADPHPSSIAHNIAARRLSRYVLKNFGDCDNTGGTQDEKRLCEDLITGAFEMQKLGYSDEYLYFHLGQVIEAKHTNKSRLQMNKDCLLADDEYQESIAALGGMSSRHSSLLYWEAYLQVLDQDCEGFYSVCSVANALVNRLSKALFVLGNNLEGTVAAHVRFFNAPPGGPDTDGLRRIPRQVSEMIERLDVLQGWLGSLADCPAPGGNSLLMRFNSRMDEHGQVVAKRIREYWGETRLLLGSIATLYSTFIQLVGRSQTLSNTDIESSILGIGNAISELVGCARQQVQCLHLDQVSEPSRGSIRKPVTCCQVRISSDTEKPFTIWVQSKSIVPARKPVSDMRWVVCDGKSHLYKFEFPVFYLGQVSIRLYPETDATVDEVLLFNHVDFKARFDLSADNPTTSGDYRLPPVLLVP